MSTVCNHVTFLSRLLFRRHEMHGTHDSYNVFPRHLWFSNIWDYFVSGSFEKRITCGINTLFRSVSTITVQAGWLFLSFFCIFFFIINILPSRFDTSGVNTNGDVECTMIRVCIKPLRSSDLSNLNRNYRRRERLSTVSSFLPFRSMCWLGYFPEKKGSLSNHWSRLLWILPFVLIMMLTTLSFLVCAKLAIPRKKLYLTIDLA